MFAKLNESGWCDEVRHKSKGHYSPLMKSRELWLNERVGAEMARNMDPLSFTKLLAEITPRAASSMSYFVPTVLYTHISGAASIPLAVKREVSTVIRQHLEKQFE